MLYGDLPKDLGLIDISPVEMMCWLYCPISLPGDGLTTLPANLEQFRPIIKAAREDNHKRWSDHYVYLTAKTLYVEGTHVGNRPGWHSDGFGTDDINYIWSDRAPTEFQHIDPPRKLSPDCDRSMRQMEHWREYAIHHPGAVKMVTYPDKHLLRLDQTVIHRSPVGFEQGMRTFVKVSISKDRYDLIGNSINHDLPDSRWDLVERQTTRNHPASRSAS